LLNASRSMRSFDFYDTLVVRMVANPADIFSLVGERLNIPDFRSMRIAAEVAARSAFGGEVTFQQIYDYVPLASNLKEKARSLELDLERSLVVPVMAVSSQIRTGDLIISDMYHDESLYHNVLQRLVPGVVPCAVLVSGRAGVNKASGELWKRVAADYPGHESHLGDNMLADVSQARRHGLVADHFGGAVLNRYEKAMARQGGDGSIIAGASRATRLSMIRSDSAPAEAATIEAFASVFGPLLHAFVHWITRACAERGIRDVYFLARDGQLPFRMCSRLVAESGQDLRCHYIFASRQALHLPGCITIDDAETWLLEDTPQLTLRIVAERACIPLDVVVEAAKRHLSVGPEDNIPRRERQFLGSVIRDPLFVDAFMASVARAVEPASAYYLMQGFASREDVALVDVGWNGRLQRSLGTLLEKSGHRPEQFLGLYLCLSKRLSNAPGDDLRGFVADPERPELVAFFDRYRHVFEAALSADHPSTFGFEFSNGAARPLFGDPYSPATEQKIAIQHATLEVFVENTIALGRAAGRPIISPAETAIENFMTFLSRPTLRDGLAFEGFAFVDGQTGAETKPISRILRATELLKPTRDLGYWPEGTLSASGLSVVASLRRAARRLRWRSRALSLR
jgi:predicted HAD superfamily hydrolase